MLKDFITNLMIVLKLNQFNQCDVKVVPDVGVTTGILHECCFALVLACFGLPARDV
jgi:hypothetical protein